MAVPWNAECIEVDERLWSMLSRLPVVKRSFLRTLGYTTPASSKEANALFATPVAICCTRSYDTDSLSQKGCRSSHAFASYCETTEKKRVNVICITHREQPSWILFQSNIYGILRHLIEFFDPKIL